MDTSPTLLERLRRPGEEAAWARFVELYTPLLYYWACRAGLQQADAADLVQDVLTTLVRKLPEFSYDRQRSFRGWLRAVALNRWRDQRRRRAARPAQVSPRALDELLGARNEDPFGEVEYRRELVARALQLIAGEFRPATWKAWSEHVLAGRPASEVAAELGVSEGAIYTAKSRVLARLRRELDGLLD